MQCCPTCGQSVELRKISFNRTMLSALMKAYRACDSHNQKVDIKELGLTNQEYTNISSLVYFNLLVRTKPGTYIVPTERVWQFLNNKATVPAFVWKDPIRKKVTPSTTRITIKQIPKISALKEELGEFLTEYTTNPNFPQGQLCIK